MSLPPKCLCCQCCTGVAASTETICYDLSCEAPAPASLPEKRLAGLGIRAEVICIGNALPGISRSGPGGSSVNDSNERRASAASPIASLSRGAEAAPGVLLALGC